MGSQGFENPYLKTKFENNLNAHFNELLVYFRISHGLFEKFGRIFFPITVCNSENLPNKTPEDFGSIYSMFT